MRIAARWAALLCGTMTTFGVLPAAAQDTPPPPRIEFFGGVSYLRFDSPTFGFNGDSGLIGYNAEITGNLVPGFGVLAELSGQYGAHFNMRDVALGPQFSYPKGQFTFFGHALFGKSRTFIMEGAGVGDTGSTAILGGGVEMDFRRHFALRIIQADYVHTRLLDVGQNNIRLSTGLVFQWGAIKHKGHRGPIKKSP